MIHWLVHWGPVRSQRRWQLTIGRSWGRTERERRFVRVRKTRQKEKATEERDNENGYINLAFLVFYQGLNICDLLISSHHHSPIFNQRWDFLYRFAWSWHTLHFDLMPQLWCVRYHVDLLCKSGFSTDTETQYRPWSTLQTETASWLYRKCHQICTKFWTSVSASNHGDWTLYAIRKTNVGHRWARRSHWRRWGMHIFMWSLISRVGS